ncbi:type III effector [Ralstonia solanacearum]|uniref:Type III effector n=1 Tax=Ralstonia solanacearum TaxID=305 RepID=A0AAW5ZKP5_RALSL|nr:type III effector [Ralstonia solanacearum]MDB0570531.1 type III effector [Ralstonia solanacearum]
MRRALGKVGNFLRVSSSSSGSSRGRTQEVEEGSSRRAARSRSPEFENLRSRSSSAASSPVYSRSNSATSSPARSRPISTVASPTRFDGRGRVTDPGHIQYQTSEWEREQYGLSDAIGHSRFTGYGAPRPERFPVEGHLSNGQYFNVTGVRGPAINAGDDHVIDHGYASHVIDHGEMSYDQAARYREYQDQPVFPSYETSGYDRSNCVHGHAELGRQIFGWEIQHHQHATPQDLAEQMRGLNVNDYNHRSYRNGSDSDSE